jgi:hypothetical protein
MVFDLPHSDGCFVQAFPAETAEAFLEGHVRAFQYFGAGPSRILYDNTTLAVARILGDGERQKTRAFSELQSHYLFAEKFGRPGKGNDKGKVENLVGYARRNFMVPIPRASSWEELNAHLEADCRGRRERRLRGHTETIGELFQRDRVAMLALPAAPYEPCEKVTARVNSLALVRYRTNDHSVPTAYGYGAGKVEPYFYESRRVRIGQRLDEDAIHYAEDRCRPTDAEGQRQGGYCCEAPIAQQLTQPIANVPGENLHNVPGAHCADPLLDLLDTANFDKRFSSGHR